ncbi:tyrosine-type recombinase/integrase [Pedobacter helvus]|uniref:Tyrosine-type recombinase/integrase n=1 Tax=Pedobacter helvus TaxID=2563444 RepID=A0ABW9JDK3_9SPHI|nr:site-specific integrase [Pedobacter ureilyticus]
MEKNYTTPVIKKGAEITFVPKGSTKKIEQAKKPWYIEYYYEGRQVRVRPDNLNRIKNPDEKQSKADNEIEALIADLRDGYNPFRPTDYLTKIEIEKLTFKDAIEKFEKFHRENYSKEKTIKCYKSKLHALRDYLPDDILLSDIHKAHLESFVRSKVDDGTYSQATLKFAKRTFSAFFAVMMELKYLEENPYLGFSKRIKSFKETDDSHLPYNDEQLAKLMEWLDINDKYVALFARTIYFTCLRPAEIKGLKVKDINLKNRTITVRKGNKKTTSGDIKDDVLPLMPSFIPFLKNMGLETANKEDFLFGDTKKFFSSTPIGENTPYNRFVKCLECLSLDKLGYDLYSIKHTSNISKFNQGWKIEKIMKFNRHRNIEQTLTYLQNITYHTDLSELDLLTI